MDYYETLGVTKSASPDEIKKAYRKLAIRYHPDKNNGDKSAEDRFKAINEAYAVLSDPEKKKQYDTYGSTGFHQRYSQEDIFRNFDINDILKQFGFGGSFSGTTFRSGMGGGRSQQQGFSSFFNQQQGGRGCGFGQPVKGQDMTYQLMVSLEDVLHGTEKQISFRKNGIAQHVSVKVPKGIEEGKKLRLKGKGGDAPPGGLAGDLYLKIQLEPHPDFDREGDDLICNKRISFSEACLGTVIEVKSINGTVFNVKVPPGTNSDARLRIKGQGLPSGPMGGRGDLFVKVGVLIPKELTKEQKEALELLEKTGL